MSDGAVSFDVGIDRNFAVKEIGMGLLGIALIQKTDTVNSSKWYGKANTVVLYTVMSSLILFQDMPVILANGLILLCAFTILFAMVMYINCYRSAWR